MYVCILNTALTFLGTLPAIVPLAPALKPPRAKLGLAYRVETKSPIACMSATPNSRSNCMSLMMPIPPISLEALRIAGRCVLNRSLDSPFIPLYPAHAVPAIKSTNHLSGRISPFSIGVKNSGIEASVTNGSFKIVSVLAARCSHLRVAMLAIS